MRKVIIAYDGSPCSKAAILDLKHAGLGEDVDATILVVADVWLPPENESTQDNYPDSHLPTLQHAHQHAKAAVEEALVLSVEGAQFLRQLFPQWIVHTETCSDSPAWALVKKSEEWNAEMIVVGSHGRSAFERVLIGSVSQMVATNARCTVRIGRARSKTEDAPLRLLIGYDGSENAEAVIEAVTNRSWPAGTQAQVLIAIDDVVATVHPWRVPGFITWSVGEPGESYQSASEWVQKMADSAAARLRSKGLIVEPVVRHGSPKHILLEVANEWEADCLFVGARGLGRFERFLLGSVSNTVTNRSHCSVEIVRKAKA